MRTKTLVQQLVNSFIILLLLCGGCADKKSHADTPIRFGISTEPVTLDPRFATDAVSDRIVRLLFASLISFDEGFHPQPELAEWEKINPKLYRFTLKKNRRDFHNGMVLTAEDVKATYDSVIDPATISPHRASLKMIEKIEAPDTDTIDFYLNKPDSLFPGRLVLGIMPAPLLQQSHPFNQSPVGSGPLKFLQWPQSADLTVERLSDGKRINFITVKDPTVRVLKLKRGELDLFQGDVPQEMLRWLDKQADVETQKNEGTVFSYLGFNLQDAVMSQHKVRLAIALALERDAVIEHVFGNSARAANAMFIPEHWVGNPELKAYQQDLDRAKNILKNLGYDKKNTLKISYKTSNNPFRIRLATVIQHQLKQVGIEVAIQSYDWGTFYGDIKAGRFQMYSLSWVGLKLPDVFRYVFHSESVPPAGANRGRFADRHVDGLIEQAEVSTEQEQQTGLYRQLQAYLLEQLPYVPLWFEDNVLVHHQNISGYQLTLDGNYAGLLDVQKQVKTN